MCYISLEAVGFPERSSVVHRVSEKYLLFEEESTEYKYKSLNKQKREIKVKKVGKNSQRIIIHIMLSITMITK